MMLKSAANHQDVLNKSSEETDEMQQSNISTQEKEIILEQRRNIENILLRSWLNNPHTPGSGRMCSLSAVTRWSPDSIRKWFRQKTVEQRDQERQDTDALKKEQRIAQLLVASFEMNPRTPTMRSTRMRELQTITGRTSTYIQDWFSRQRVRDQYETLCKEKAILIAAFEEDPTLPVCQSERMSELMEKTGRSVWYIQDWFSRLLKQYETKRRKITLKNPLSMEETEQVNEEIKKRYEEMALQKRTRRKKRDAPVRYQDAETNGHVTVCNDPHDDIRRVQHETLSNGGDAFQVATPGHDRLTNGNRHVITISSDAVNSPVVILEEIAEEEQASKENGEEYTESRYQPVSFISNSEDEYCKVLTSNDDEGDQSVENDDNTADMLDMVEEKEQQTSESVPSSAVEKAKKCPICDKVCAVQSISIVSMKEANQLDKHFGSSLTHFLTYTRVVCVCIEHALEYRESTR